MILKTSCLHFVPIVDNVDCFTNKDDFKKMKKQITKINLV